MASQDVDLQKMVPQGNSSHEVALKTTSGRGNIESGSLAQLTKFHLFPNLPSELRSIIWVLAQPDPRIARVSFDEERVEAIPPQTRYTTRYGSKNRATYRYGTFTAPCVVTPSLLHVNREARQQTLRNYQLFTLKASSKCRPLNFYANLEVDCIHMSSTGLLTWSKGYEDMYFTKQASRMRELAAWTKRILKERPKHFSITYEYWRELDLKMVVQELSGVELTIVFNSIPEDLDREYSDEYPFSESFERELDFGMLFHEPHFLPLEDEWFLLYWGPNFSIDKISEKINQTAEELGIKAFVTPQVRIMRLDGIDSY